MARGAHSGRSAFHVLTFFSRVIPLNWLKTLIINWLVLEKSVLLRTLSPIPLHFCPTHKLDGPTVLSQLLPDERFMLVLPLETLKSVYNQLQKKGGKAAAQQWKWSCPKNLSSACWGWSADHGQPCWTELKTRKAEFDSFLEIRNPFSSSSFPFLFAWWSLPGK